MGATAAEVWTTVQAIRERGPLVHNLANYVSMDIMANLLLAAGASPVMAHATEEVGAFAAMAGAVTVNMGTLDDRWVESMQAAATAASQAGTPWLLDPVGVGATRYRTGVAQMLLKLKPQVIRGNASEVMALLGAQAGLEGGGKGVDSLHGSDEALSAAQALAASSGAVVVVTGARDYVTDGSHGGQVDNGHPLMARVTATGCSLTAFMGAALSVQPDRVSACLHALAAYGIAGEIAAERAQGPGSFRVAFLDAIAGLTEAQIAERARLA
ncbi:MAG: hydroxyethylthiazole kinase [Pseudomonadota bacterium]